MLGGEIGGEKYLVNSILFKFAVATHSIYGLTFVDQLLTCRW